MVKTSSSTQRKRVQNVILPNVLMIFANCDTQTRSRPGCPCFLLGLPVLPKPSNNKQTCNENLVERCVQRRTTHQHRIKKKHKTPISVIVFINDTPTVNRWSRSWSLFKRAVAGIAPPITGPAECTKRSNTRFKVGAWPKALKF